MTRCLLARAAMALALVWTLSGCPGGDPPTDAALPAPRILSIEVPSPALPGSYLRVTGVDLDRLGADPTLSGARGIVADLHALRGREQR